jgi:hypothetical protein
MISPSRSYVVVLKRLARTQDNPTVSFRIIGIVSFLASYSALEIPAVSHDYIQPLTVNYYGHRKIPILPESPLGEILLYYSVIVVQPFLDSGEDIAFPGRALLL